MANILCDIIVPIYNAYEDVLECIDSIVNNTDRENYRLILINDKSTDERIEQYLNKLHNEKIIVMNNEVNLGFVKTVNRGIKFSNNDVILLNSDTVVTKNWLTKITECAYSDENIATVTPLTNSGTICSVPNFCEDNDIPQNFNLEEYAEMIEKISLKKYPTIVTGVGFCMHIKRSVINKIGILDEENFNKGYGEENDFCCRAKEHGYINVLCDDTFIYHKGSMSFKEDKKKYIEENLKVLFNKYPYYNSSVQKFISQNPIKDIQENIKFHIKLNNGKKNILYIIHNGVLKDINNPRGGTEFHLLDLVNNIEKFNKYVLVSTGKELILTVFVDDEVIEFKFDIQDELNIETFENNKYEKILEEILCAFKIDLVHVQHNKNHILNIPKVTKKNNIPTIITLHDFYTICPTINLLDLNGEYCKNTRCKEVCQKCIKNKIGYNTNFLETWNCKVKQILKAYDKIIVPSQSAKEIIQDYYNDIKLEIDVIEHGTDKVKVTRNQIVDNNNFNIAFIGGLAPYKGSGIIHELVTKNKDKNIKWYLLGNLGDQRLNLLEREDLIKYGRYERTEINNILYDLKIDLVCILSIWPETYAYTLTEAWQSKIPVLVTDVGALGERVKKANAGWTVKLGTKSDEILEIINKIKNNKNEYFEKFNNINSIVFRDKKQMSDIYVNIYSKLIGNNKIDSPIDANYIYKAYQIANISNKIATNTSDELNVEFYNKISQLEAELNTIKNTVGWKALNKLREKTPDFIKILKKIMYIFVRKGYK